MSKLEELSQRLATVGAEMAKIESQKRLIQDALEKIHEVATSLGITLEDIDLYFKSKVKGKAGAAAKNRAITKAAAPTKTKAHVAPKGRAKMGAKAVSRAAAPAKAAAHAPAAKSTAKAATHNQAKIAGGKAKRKVPGKRTSELATREPTEPFVFGSQPGQSNPPPSDFAPMTLGGAPNAEPDGTPQKAATQPEPAKEDSAAASPAREPRAIKTYDMSGSAVDE